MVAASECDIAVVCRLLQRGQKTLLLEKTNLTADGEANCCSARYRQEYRCGRVGEKKGRESEGGDVRSHGAGRPRLPKLVGEIYRRTVVLKQSGLCSENRSRISRDLAMRTAALRNRRRPIISGLPRHVARRTRSCPPAGVLHGQVWFQPLWV